MLIASLRIATTYKIFNFTIDEPAHIACGAQWLEGAEYLYEPQHPPLARVVAMLGVSYAGNHWGGDPNMWMEGLKLLGGGHNHERGLVFGRAAMLPFFWIACAAVFLWARSIRGDVAGLFGLALFTSLPPVLAHAGLITTDMALTAFAGSAFLAALYWADKPVYSRGALLGFLGGLAFLSKFSAIPFLVSSIALLYLVHLLRTLPDVRQTYLKLRTALPSALLALAVLFLTVWAGYRFSFGPTSLFSFSVPAPEFITGIQDVLTHNSQGHISYLLGHTSMKGHWYYYLVDLGIKTPLAVLVLFIVSLLVAAIRRDGSVVAPCVFTAAILGFSMFFSNINIGIRHVLPVYIGMSVVISAGLSPLLRSRMPSFASLSILALVVWAWISGALQHPDYLAYTNELFWNHPELVLADSDVDWGQDMKRLAQRMQALGVHSIHFEPFNVGYGLAKLPFPAMEPVSGGSHPQPGWTAVSITRWKLAGGPAWLDYTPYTERVGRSILLFHADVAAPK